MKTIFFMTALAVAMLFSACSKEEIDDGTRTLTVKVEAASSRAIQAPGTTAAITLSTGVIFLIAPDGSVDIATAIVPAEVQGAGQIFTGVPSSSRVFIVGNPTIAAQTELLAATSFAAIQAITTDALSYQSTLFSAVALSNADGNPAGISITSPATATVNVSISPVIARLELAGVTGGIYVEMNAGTPTGNQTRITGFDVIGVFLDSYFPNFTYVGGGQGTLVEINQTQVANPALVPTWPGIQDRSTWTASGTPLVVTPGTGQVWAYNVPATQLSRLVIAVDNVTYEASTDGGTGWAPGTSGNYAGIQYITVGGLNVTLGGNTALATQLDRGVIYQIPASGLVFNTSNLHPNPNPVDVDLTVNVTIQNWILAPSETILE